jgi:hypothetical protein
LLLFLLRMFDPSLVFLAVSIDLVFLLVGFGGRNFSKRRFIDGFPLLTDQRICKKRLRLDNRSKSRHTSDDPTVYLSLKIYFRQIPVRYDMIFLPREKTFMPMWILGKKL